MKQKFNPALQKYEPELPLLKKGKIKPDKNLKYKLIGLLIFIIVVAMGIYFLSKFY